MSPTLPAPSPQRLREVFDAALELESEARESFLKDTCGPDAALHTAATSLLRAFQASGGFLTSATLSHQGEALTEAGGLQPGDRIGPCEITGELGRGGGGVVYLARQHSPVDREVALKMLSATPDSHQAAQRFRSEQRTLARLEHEHIARLYDAGVDAHGRLWIAMELVRGEPIGAYCDRYELSLPARLRLMVAICRAVHHAHLLGVIHRDLKPSNLLVTGPAAQPVPKIIDFGIARAMENSEDECPTLAGVLIGTPAYMSPEQFGDGSGIAIDARTDIYSLGLVLFEILTGVRHRATPSAASAALHAARASASAMDEWTAPAQRFAALPQEQQSRIAISRQTDPSALRRFLSGDAGRIITRCLQRNPVDRFPSAESLAVDLENVLAHRPLSFRKPGWTYPVRKFLRRHRIAAAITALGLIAAMAGLGVGLHSHMARLEAEVRAHAEATRAEEEAARALREGRKGYLITEAMTGLFRNASADFGHSTARTVRSVVEAWTAGLPDSITEDPEVEALVRLSLGNAWNGFGEPEKSRQQFDAAVALLTAPSPPFVPARALAELNLGVLAFERRDFDTAEAHLQHARRFFQAAGSYYTGGLLRAELLIAGHRTKLRQTPEATAIARRVLDEAERLLPRDLELQARAHWQLSRAAKVAGDLITWDRHLRRRLELTLQDKNAVPTVLLEAKFDVLRADYIATPTDNRTLAALDKLLTDYQSLTNPGHPTLLAFRADIAELLADTGHPAAAAERYRALLHQFPDAASSVEWQQSLDGLP